MDRYAIKSLRAAVRARENGFFDRDIVPVRLPNGRRSARTTE
jgi:acetyl-CoA acetyltransferase